MVSGAGGVVKSLKGCKLLKPPLHNRPPHTSASDATCTSPKRKEVWWVQEREMGSGAYHRTWVHPFRSLSIPAMLTFYPVLSPLNPIPPSCLSYLLNLLQQMVTCLPTSIPAAPIQCTARKCFECCFSNSRMPACPDKHHKTQRLTPEWICLRSVLVVPIPVSLLHFTDVNVYV